VGGMGTAGGEEREREREEGRICGKRGCNEAASQARI